ncbi:hypothetical protein MUP01_04065 [Candidatus Bathyarchaeota archaeon]|nr:hypothetical protein [Candidatus Bathyarchaeota archaeon]
MPTIKIPNFESGDSLLVKIRSKPFTEKDHRELLTKVVLLSALRDRGLAKQGIRVEVPETFNGETITATGLQVAAYLAERFKELEVPPKTWQIRVRGYEQNSPGQLNTLRQDISESIGTLEHTEALQEVNRAYAYLQKNYPVPRDARLREGELSGLANPDQTVQVVQPDDNGQCPRGMMWSARLGGCVSIDDGTASTAFDITAGGNRADSDLRKARAGTSRKQFTPEGTEVALDQGGSDRKHPDNDSTPNRAMGNAGIETSDRNIDTEQMPGGSRVSDVTVQARIRQKESLRQLEMQVQKANQTREGELSGMANPDQILKGVDPDSKGQCPRGYLFSALVGKCIQLSVDQQADALRGNRTQHFPEGTVTRMGRTYGHDNSGEPNPAMGFRGPLARLEDEGWMSLSSHYAMCMFMLKEARYSYYASRHASERFCFLPFEGKNDGYINGHGEMSHMTVFHLTENDERALNEWLKADEKDYNEKTGMDTAYEQLLQQRLSYRPALTELISRGSTDEQIQRILEEKAGLTHKTVRSLMSDVRVLRGVGSTIKGKPRPRVIVKMDSKPAEQDGGSD